MYQPCVDDTCLKPRCRILQVSEEEYFCHAPQPTKPNAPLRSAHKLSARALGVTLTVIYLSNFLAHFLPASPDDIKQALRLIRQRTGEAAHRGGRGPGLSGSEAITVARTVRARNVRKMLVNDMKPARQAGKAFWPQPSVKTEPNWQGKVKLERQRR